MLTIDLLKGQGIPIKSRPEGVAVGTLTFAVPIIIAIVMFGYYLTSSIDISIKKQEIVRYETEIDKLSSAVKLQKSLNKQRNTIDNNLSEVASSINRYTQWSPILATLAENMPGSLVLTELDVKQRFEKRTVPKKDDPGKMVNISVSAKTLQMRISGALQSDCDKAVRDFRDSLLFSRRLGPKLEDIKVSQDIGKLDGQDVVSYQIDCIFKPEL